MKPFTIPAHSYVRLNMRLTPEHVEAMQKGGSIDFSLAPTVWGCNDCSYECANSPTMEIHQATFKHSIRVRFKRWLMGRV